MGTHDLAFPSDQLGRALAVQGASVLYAKGQFAIVKIASDVSSGAGSLEAGLYTKPLKFGTSDLSRTRMDNWQSYIESGQVGLYIDKIIDTSQIYMDWDYDGVSPNTIDLYFGLGDSDTDITVEVTDSAQGELSVTYSSPEKEQLRNLFGQPKDSTMESIIRDGVVTLAKQVASYRQGETRFKSNAIKTKPFTDDELTLLTEKEEGQGVSLSLETITGSAGVTSTSTYKAGGMS
jgi:hypothetical protein